MENDKPQTVLAHMYVIDRATAKALAAQYGCTVPEMMHRIMAEFIKTEETAGRKIVVLPHLAQALNEQS